MLNSMDTNTRFLTFAPLIESDAAGIPTGFSGVAYSGGIIPDYGWYGDSVIDLASVTVPDRMFALVIHDDDQRAGHCRVWLDANTIRVAGTFSKVTEAGKSVAAEFAEGAPWKLSLGINSRFDSYSPPLSAEINGQSMQVSGVFRNARILEVSFVPADADPNTTVTAFAADPIIQSKDTDMSDALNLKITELTATVAELSAKLAGETTRADTAETRLKDQQQAVRLSAVKALFEATGHEYEDVKAQPYLTMDEATFSAVADDLRASRAGIDPSLFSATATKGKPAQEVVELSATNIYELRNKQISNMRGAA
jgi:hypothetical protein